MHSEHENMTHTEEHDHTQSKHQHRHQHHEGHAEHDHTGHHAHMVEDFKRRFWVSLALTAPVFVLSPMIQALVGLEGLLRFTGELYLLFGLSTVVFFYGGYPFLKGLVTELKAMGIRCMMLTGDNRAGHRMGR